MFVDSHAHLASLSPEQLRETVARAAEMGISTIVNIGTNIETSQIVCDQCSNKFPLKMFAAAAVSPPDIGFVTESWESDLRTLLERPETVAVGEIGIDGVNSSYLSLEQQRPFYHRQLALAKEYNLPAIIHGRGVEREALETCVSMGISKALFHCFTGTAEDALLIAQAGYTLSFSGIITFKKSEFDEILRSIPSQHLLLETDSPYLAPVPVRGTMNEPANVAHVYRYAAAVRGVSPDVLAEECQRTFDSLFFS